jgi:multidrug resistance efflux pump
MFQGFLIAKNATVFYAPEFVFRVSGWNSDWGARKIVELAPDGKAVKAGDVLVRFEFGAEEALQYVNQRIQTAESTAQQDHIAAGQAIEGLEIAQRRREIDRQTARLNLEKAPALSRLQADALKIEEQLASFDVDASAQQLESARASWAAVEDFNRQTVAAAHEGKDRYDFYVGRFAVRAPVDGVVRHAFNPRERRKLQKGDNAQSGMKVVSLAKDDALAVRFFVPEAEASGVKVGDAISVVVPTTADEVKGVVIAVDFFPQELGYLLENDSLPNGREKAIAVRASLDSPPSSLAAGTEIKVRLKASP